MQTMSSAEHLRIYETRLLTARDGLLSAGTYGLPSYHFAWFYLKDAARHARKAGDFYRWSLAMTAIRHIRRAMRKLEND